MKQSSFMGTILITFIIVVTSLMLCSCNTKQDTQDNFKRTYIELWNDYLSTIPDSVLVDAAIFIDPASGRRMLQPKLPRVMGRRPHLLPRP